MSNKPDAAPDFENALRELESLVEKMEQGELTLEQSLSLFERGVSLTRVCQEALSNAQLKVEKLLEQDEDAGQSQEPKSD